MSILCISRSRRRYFTNSSNRAGSRKALRQVDILQAQLDCTARRSPCCRRIRSPGPNCFEAWRFFDRCGLGSAATSCPPCCRGSTAGSTCPPRGRSSSDNVSTGENGIPAAIRHCTKQQQRSHARTHAIISKKLMFFLDTHESMRPLEFLSRFEWRKPPA